jgi:adenosine deaminase
MPPADRFRRLSKAELHVHLDGSLRVRTLTELARSAGVALPAADPEALRLLMRADDARSLDDYLQRFALTVAVLQTPSALERVAFEMAGDAAEDGVRYLEVRYCPALSRQQGLTLDEVIAAVARGLQRGEAAYRIRCGMINCTLRHFEPALSEEIAEASVRQRGLGVVGFDIAGAESGHPAGPHRHAFEIAARGHLGTTAHAGEAAGPESIAEAIFECGANRIGHGTRLHEDPELMAYVRDRSIPVEINLTSNIQTRVVPDARSHPLRQYLDAGLVVTLCTDNWLMSGVTLSGEYDLAARTFALRDAEIESLVLSGFRSAFLPLPDRDAMAREALERCREDWWVEG